MRIVNIILIVSITIILSILPINVYAADYYKVLVTRKAKNLYKIERIYPVTHIVTERCYQYALMDEAILKIDRPYSSRNRIIFDNGSSCKIKEFIR